MRSTFNALVPAGGRPSNLASRAIVSLLATLFAALPLLANGDIPWAKPEEVGLSSERLQLINERMESYLAREEMAGAVGVIARRGKVVYLETWGEADRENQVPMTADSIFRIYSMTKPITGVALMMLYEQGKFFLNDPVGKYLPELTKMEVMEETVDPETGETTWATVPAKRPVTIRDLMRHTAGFTYGVFGNTPVDKMYREAGILFEDRDIEEMTKKLGEIPLQYQPGTKWHYSVSVDIQGRLVEVLSGMPFDEFLDRKIFQPLGMVDTGFAVPEKDLGRFAQLYAPAGTGDAGTEVFLSRNDSKSIEVASELASRNYYGEPTFHSGGGGLVSTARDYLRFSQMMLNGGELDGVRLLSRKTVELMTTDHLGDISMGMGQKGYGFGLDFAVAIDQGEIGELGTEGEYNWGGAAGTRFWIDPKEELIGVFMIQILPHRTTIGSEFRNLTYQAVID